MSPEKMMTEMLFFFNSATRFNVDTYAVVGLSHRPFFITYGVESFSACLFETCNHITIAAVLPNPIHNKSIGVN